MPPKLPEPTGNLENLWKVFEDFQPPPMKLPAWATLLELGQDLIKVNAAASRKLEALQSRWDEHLNGIGGDPSRHDWTDFRPLRLSREEDWSDWLAHLIQTSADPTWWRHLFGSSENGKLRKVHREVSTKDNYRADIIIENVNGDSTHIEVKLWDQSFEKTFPTALSLQNNEKPWTHRILLPRENLNAWETIVPKKGDPVIGAVTWNQLVIALRQCLMSGLESVTWKVWARTYIGAIEQTILGIPHLPKEAGLQPRQINKIFMFLQILEEGTIHEKK